MPTIPSQHIDCSDGIRSASTSLIIYGVPRSASTFTWQVMSDICDKRGVARTHKFLVVSPLVPMVLTVRDWRDTVVSYWRSQNGHPTDVFMQAEEIYQYVAIYQQYIWVLDQWRLTRPKAPLLRYEDTIKDPGRLFAVAEKLGLPEITNTRKAEILAAHSVVVNRAVSNNQTAQDRATLLSPRHLHEAGTGTWRRFVDKEGTALITKLLLPALIEYGYEPTPPPLPPPPPVPAPPKPAPKPVPEPKK